MPSQQHDHLPQERTPNPVSQVLGLNLGAQGNVQRLGDSTRGIFNQLQYQCQCWLTKWLFYSLPEMNLLERWIPLPAKMLQEMAEGDAPMWWNPVYSQRSGLSINLIQVLSQCCDLPCIFSVGHSHLCTILFVCFYFIVSFLLKKV